MSFVPESSDVSSPAVAVTGATGHVGVNLVRALLAKGHRVRALIHSSGKALDALGDVEQVQGDVLDPDSLRQAFDGVDFVYHLAAVISIQGDKGGRVSRVNVEGARNVARAALECGVRRLIHCSSIHAFETEPLDEVIDETRSRALAKKHFAYDRSKAMGEAAVREVIEDGLDAVILHPTGILGPYDYGPSRMGEVLLGLYHRKLPTLLHGGFDFVDVRDLCETMIRASEAGRKAESYIVGGHWISIAEIASLAEQITGVRPPRLTSPMWLARVTAPFFTAWAKLTRSEALYTKESLRALVTYRQLSSEKARVELGHQCRPTAESLRAAYDWFAEAGYLRGELPVREEVKTG